MLLCVMLYEGVPLFTRKVDFPGRRAYGAYPWKARVRRPVRANTGISLQQIAPWTEAGRRSLRAGEWPLWNRAAGSGIPLMSDQQSSIFHPFTLAGLWLSFGKAETLSICLRLWFALFFTFVFLRNWGLRESAALFGAIAYGFSTFHIVWLTMPHALTAMMLPMALATTDELVRHAALKRSFLAAATALAMTLLAGHPELEFFVALTVGAYALYAAISWKRMLIAAAAAVTALLLTAFYWYPFIAVVPLSERYAEMAALRASPPQHVIGPPWLMTLVSADILGTVPGGTYRAPGSPTPALLDDYGEIASGYTGLITLSLAFAGLLFCAKRRPALFAAGAMLFAFLTIKEVPGWIDVIHRVPLLDLALLQRFRFLWNLGTVILASVALDSLMREEMRFRRVLLASGITVALFGLVVAAGLPPLLRRGVSGLELAQIAAPFVVLVVATALLSARRVLPVSALVFAELVFVTWHYNPPSSPRDVYPATGAIRAMQSDPNPHRIVALGWSFLPDTPGFYGLEDVKTTDPMVTPQYLRLLRGYFAMRNDWDQGVGATKYAFVDFLNVSYLYVPPGEDPLRSDVVRVYHGTDGDVFRNDRVLPRYFFPATFEVEPSFDVTVAKLKQISDFRQEAIVDRIPREIVGMAPALSPVKNGQVGWPAGTLRLVRYAPNATDLDVNCPGWSLLASSDAWWPGWRVDWNGKRIPTVRVNGSFVGAFLPPGDAHVTLRYAPSAFETGLWIALATLIVIVVLGIVNLVVAGAARKRGLREPRPA